MFKNKVEKSCDILHIVFLQHRVEIRGLETKNHMKPGKEVLAEHHCSYASVKCVLGAKPPDVDMRFFFKNPCGFCFQPFVSLALIGSKTLFLFDRQCLCG